MTAYKGNLLKHLRAFIQTARSGSVSAAAERLYLSQPSVSQQIRALEDGLGRKLFERRGPRLQLTPAGKVLLEMSRPLVEKMDALPAEFQQRHSTLDRGEIRVGAGELAMQHLMPALLARFRKQHPGIIVQLDEFIGQRGISRLREDNLDFAVDSMLDIPDGIEYRPLWRFGPALIMRPDHPLARRSSIELADISPHGLVLPPRNQRAHQLVDFVFKQNALPFRVNLEVGGWEVIKRFVALGMGISIVSSLCLTEDDRKRFVVRDLGRYFPVRSCGVILRRGAYMSPQASRFISMMSPDLFGQ
ncbi:MAG TPA: LysR family transcriptional regulator [Wenzhouxiangella sp.]|nr:LysR family transcriptional regulator [Wenzhouxiangella sp.]